MVNVAITKMTVKEQMDLVQTIKSSPVIKDFAWISKPISNNGLKINVGNVGGLVSQNANVYTTSPNFFSLTKKSFTIPEKGYSYPITQLLYDKSAGSSAILSSNIRTLLAGDKRGKDWKISLRPINGTIKGEPLVFSPQTFLTMAPVARFSAMSFNIPAAIVSIPDYITLSNNTILSVDSIPVSRFLFQLVPTITDADIDLLIFQLRSVVNLKNVSVNRFDDKDIKLYSNILSSIYQMMVILAMVICAFSLISAMYVNVMEQVQEIGILRSLGFRNFDLYRIYSYESFILIISSCMLGVNCIIDCRLL